MGRPKIRWATGWTETTKTLTGETETKFFGARKAAFKRAHKLTGDSDPNRIQSGFYCFEGNGATSWVQRVKYDAKKKPLE